MSLNAKTTLGRSYELCTRQQLCPLAPTIYTLSILAHSMLVAPTTTSTLCPMRIALSFALVALAGCATVPASLTEPASKPAAEQHVKSQKLVGTTSFDGGSLPADALVVVQLIGKSAKGDLVVLGSDRVSPSGAEGPISYEVPYARTQLAGVTELQVFAEVLDGLGNARWTGANSIDGAAIPNRFDMFLNPVQLTSKDGE